MDGPFLNPYAPITIHTRHLPHWQQPGALVFLIWRLADSLPSTLLESWQTERTAWLALHPSPWDAATEISYRETFTDRIDHWLDAGHGSCVLRDPTCSSLVENALRHFDGQRYALDSFVIMPSHVHAIIRLVADHPLPTVVKSWKSFSARKINDHHATTGPLWQEDYWDRLIRDASHLHRCRDYIGRNPGKALLAPAAYRLHIGDAVY
ncbi:MAG: transposase [Opitutaceae bacterium]|jgi:REP element-mobilizing transposase RayT